MLDLHPDEVRLLLRGLVVPMLALLLVLPVADLARRWLAYQRTGSFEIEAKLELSRADRIRLVVLPLQIAFFLGVAWCLSQVPAGWQRDLAKLGVVLLLFAIAWLLMCSTRRSLEWRTAEAERAERFGRPPRRRRCD